MKKTSLTKQFMSTVTLKLHSHWQWINLITVGC